jgi:hypothetical protein
MAQAVLAEMLHPLAELVNIGARLLTRKIESQQREGVIIANLVNLWNSFGKAVCVQNV